MGVGELDVFFCYAVALVFIVAAASVAQLLAGVGYVAQCAVRVLSGIERHAFPWSFALTCPSASCSGRRCV